MGVRAVRGCSKTSGAEILIKMNMIYSLTGQSEPKGARTENRAFISLSAIHWGGGEREKNVLPGKNRAGMDHATPWLHLPASITGFLLHSSTCAFCSKWSGIMFWGFFFGGGEHPWRTSSEGPVMFPWALIGDIRLADSVQQGVPLFSGSLQLRYRWSSGQDKTVACCCNETILIFNFSLNNHHEYTLQHFFCFFHILLHPGHDAPSISFPSFVEQQHTHKFRLVPPPVWWNPSEGAR